MTSQPASCRLIDTKELDRIVRDFGTDEDTGFGCLSTDEGLLPLKAMDIEAQITGTLATTTLTQEYKNVHDCPLEATYIFPLPSRAAVTRFVMEVAERKIEGILKERGQARQEYDEAIAQGHTAAITEEERPGVFTMRVGNIDAGELVKVTLTMTGPLPFSDGQATYRFPLVVAPRYIPGDALKGEQVGDGVAIDTDDVPDASRISPPVLLPGFKNPVKLSLVVRIDPAGLQLREVSSSLHAISTRKRKRTTVRLKEEERLNKDFILRLAYATEGITTGLVTERKDGDDEGTFLLTIVPPENTQQLPRDVVFVLDQSGSMDGWKMVCARRATARMIDALSAEDRFAFLAFDNRFTTPPGMGGKLVEATDRNRYQAVEFVSKLKARGGTNMYKPLDEAARLLAKRDKNRQRVIVLITDGQVGNEDQLVKLVRQKARGTRVFTVGIDRAVNAAFLKRLAIPTKGLCEMVESEERLDEVMTAMHRRIGRPSMTDIKIDDANLKIVAGSLVPDKLPDLFEGVPAVIMGRFTGATGGQITIKGQVGDEQYKEKLEAISEADEAIRYAWARGRIRDLEDEYVASNERDSALSDKITNFSLAQNVLCRFTAFLAVDSSETIKADGPMHQVMQPVEQVDGWAMPGGAAAPCAPMPTSCPPPSPAPMPAKSSGNFFKRKRDSRVKERMSASFDTLSSLGGGAGNGMAGGPIIEELASFSCMDLEDSLVTPEKVDVLAPYQNDLTLIIEQFNRLKTLKDDDDIVDEIGYLVGDIELLLERMENNVDAKDAVQKLVELKELFENLKVDDLLEAMVKGKEILLELSSGKSARAPKRKDFWK